MPFQSPGQRLQDTSGRTEFRASKARKLVAMLMESAVLVDLFWLLQTVSGARTQLETNLKALCVPARCCYRTLAWLIS